MGVTREEENAESEKADFKRITSNGMVKNLKQQELTYDTTDEIAVSVE
jgi:hypothetical protein